MKTKEKNNKKNNKKLALTLAELTVALAVVPLLIMAAVRTFKPKDFKVNANKEVAKTFYNDLVLITSNVSRRYSSTADLSNLKTANGSAKFELTDSGAVDKLIALYATEVKKSRSAAGSSYSGYSGNFKLKNGVFMAFKLYGNCTTATTTYNPMYNGESISEANTCGAIFFDVNDAEVPNTLGVDRYIIAIDKRGMR